MRRAAGGDLFFPCCGVSRTSEGEETDGVPWLGAVCKHIQHGSLWKLQWQAVSALQNIDSMVLSQHHLLRTVKEKSCANFINFNLICGYTWKQYFFPVFQPDDTSPQYTSGRKYVRLFLVDPIK